MQRPVTVDEVVSRLATSLLADMPVAEVSLPGEEGSTCVVDIADRDLLEGWSQAREAVHGIGLYPVAVTTWGGKDWAAVDLFSRFYYGRADDTSPAAVLARSRTLSVDEALSRFATSDDWAAANWDDVLERHLGLTEHYLGSRPSPEIFADVPVGDEMLLERRLLDWEEACRPSDPPEISESFAWFDPRPHGPVGFVLLPISDSCDASAYLSFYGADGDGGHEALLRLQREWEQCWGAQLVASWGTMLQCVATAPPTTLDDAFELAAQHARVAPSTTALPGKGVRDLTRHLWHGERWFLHERP